MNHIATNSDSPSSVILKFVFFLHCDSSFSLEVWKVIIVWWLFSWELGSVSLNAFKARGIEKICGWVPDQWDILYRAAPSIFSDTNYAFVWIFSNLGVLIAGGILKDTYKRGHLGKMFWKETKERPRIFFKVLRGSGCVSFRDNCMSPNFQKVVLLEASA